MKNKLLLFLLFFLFFVTAIIAQNSWKINNSSSVNLGLSNTLKTSKAKALIPPPLTTAGSACKEESASVVSVAMAASGGSGDVIEWFDSQTSSTILHTGPIFNTSISKTTTYYVWSHSGADFSIRVPVVASVYTNPPTVTLTVSPADNPVCEGVQLIFTANGGADLFEFSVNGVIVQQMSSNRTYVTNTLKKGETVKVRSRYGVSLDGIITEAAYGKGAMEDNFLSAPLSSGAIDAYMNSIKISPTEKELIFGLSGKLKVNSSILLFLDTKPGGFNASSFGDVASFASNVRGFNFFNNNANIFDSYFEADYCLVVSKDDGGATYLADVIELKSGSSIIGSPKPELGVNESNSAISDYDNGFEISVLKSQIGYTQGDIKFFAFTMQSDVVTNSFLSPELSSSLDYGNGPIDYNFKDPNPVVVSADALKPCYKEASISINIAEPPTPAIVGSDQFNCTLNSGSLGGNSPSIGSGVWSLKSGPGLATFSNVTNGSSTVTVDTEGIYIFTWTITNNPCSPSTADIKVEFYVPPVTPSSSNQTVCAESPIQKLTAKATVAAGESAKWYDASIGGNVVLDPSLSTIGSITYYAESVNNVSLCVSTSRTAVTLTINPIPVVPVSGGNKTECALSPIQTLTATATAGTGESIVWYDAATAGNVVSSPTLNSIGTVSYYAESINNVTGCVSTSRTVVILTLNPTPVVPVSGGNKTECAQSPFQTLTATATSQSGESIVWYGAATAGTVVSNPILNSVGTITYYAESVNSSGTCVSTSRTAVTLTINARPVVPVSGGNKTECALSPIQTLTATATAGTGESIVWYDAATAGNVVSSPTLNSIGTVSYYAESVNNVTGCVSTSRTVVTLTLNPTLVVPVSGGNKTECAQSPIQTLTATATSQSGESIVWYNAATTGTVVSNPILNSVGTITYYAQTSNNVTGCISDARTAVTLTINPNPIKPVSGGNQTVCAQSPIQTITATAAVGTGESVVWYNAATGGNVVASPVLSSIGSVTYFAQTVNDVTGCISSSRTAVTLTINSSPAAPISGGDKLECVQTPIQTLTATATVASGESIIWYSAATGGNVVASPTLNTVGTVTYHAQTFNGICTSLNRTAVTLTIVGIIPNPTASDQTVCSDGTALQTLTATATANTITWYTTAAGGSVVANPTQVGVGTKTYYAESSIGSCLSVSRTKVVLTIRAVPLKPTIINVAQPTCVKSTGAITISTQAGVEYSIGSGFQDSPVFNNLASGSYTTSVRFKNNTSCEVKGAVQIINPIPPQIQFEIIGDCVDKDYVLTANPLASSYDPNNVDYQWRDSSGSPVGTNSNILNVSDMIASTPAKEVFPLSYTLTVVSTATACETKKTITVETIYCNIQKGISPDGNGLNDYFDLKLMDVKKLEIFNRYGIKVYEQSNYTDQWKGQSNKGENLPSATYYYVMELNKGEIKTGWIYLIREK